MKTTAEKAAAALELFPEDMREPAIAYLLEQAEKFQTLKTMIQEGIEDYRSRANPGVGFRGFPATCARRAPPVALAVHADRFHGQG